MRTLTARFLAVIGLFTSLTLHADSINVTITGVSGTISGNVYVAPYYLSVNGSGDPAQGLTPGTISVICDDFTHDVTPGESWVAQVNDLNSTGLLQSRFYSSSNSAATTRLYEEAGWLAINSGIWGGTAVGSTTDLNWAIWKLFDPSLSVSQGAQNLINLAQQQAPNDFSYYSSVRILTPTNHPDGTPWTDSTSPQEYLTVVRAPEPASFLLLGSGLSLLCFRRRKKSQN